MADLHQSLTRKSWPLPDFPAFHEPVGDSLFAELDEYFVAVCEQEMLTNSLAMKEFLFSGEQVEPMLSPVSH